MSIEDLIQKLGSHPVLLLCALAFPVATAFLLPRLHKPGQGETGVWRYLYSILIHYATFPGVLACVLTGYQLFIQRGNLLSVNLLVYFLPIGVMMATLFLVTRAVDLDRIPGFDRLSGFVTTIAIAFTIALVILKLRIGLLFFSSIWTFLLLAAILYGLFRAGLRTMARGKRGNR
ncbi:MAG: hypothetical protein KAI66_13790 [Lentisphaeria bacterium]|nr:hypothetical protein [Lentisphaeria bacterium]